MKPAKSKFFFYPGKGKFSKLSALFVNLFCFFGFHYFFKRNNLREIFCTDKLTLCPFHFAAALYLKPTSATIDCCGSV